MKRAIILLLVLASLVSAGAAGTGIEEHDAKCKAFGDFVDDKPWDVELVTYSGTYCVFDGDEVICRTSSEETSLSEYNYNCIDTVDLRVYEILPGAMDLATR